MITATWQIRRAIVEGSLLLLYFMGDVAHFLERLFKRSPAGLCGGQEAIVVGTTYVSRWLTGLATLVLLVALCGAAFAQSEEEKKQPFVNKIIINGNSHFSDDELKKLMNTKESGFFSIFRKPRVRPEFLQRDIAVIAAFYHANGFLDATVELDEIKQIDDGTFVDIIIRVVENEAIRVESITFKNTGVVKEENMLKDFLLEPGDPFNPTMMQSDVYTIKKHYFDEGYLAVVVADSVEQEGKSVNLLYTIESGPIITIRSISITGNSDTRVEIIEKELALEEGEVFRLRNAVETQRNLFETGLFTEADVIPDEPDLTTNQVDLTIRVRERKSAYVEVGFGVGNIVGSRVTGEWGERNLFGTGRLLRYRTEYSFGIFETTNEDIIKYYRHEIEYGQRRLFGTKVQLRLNAFLEKDATVEDLIVLTRGASVGGIRDLTPYTDVFLELRPERIKRTTLGIPEDKSTSIILGGGVRHDRRDFVLDPKRGVYRDMNAQFAGGPLGGDNNFYTLGASWQRYWQKGGRQTTLAIRLRGGFADAFGDSRDTGVPPENRFFTGGGNSVRGFGENSLGPRELVVDQDTNIAKLTVVGGTVLLLTNIEVRFPLPYFGRYNFGGAIFADGGNTWADFGSISFKDFRLFADRDDVTDEDYRYSMGFGIRYNTPLGPIRFDYGLPIKRELTVDSSGRFHFSLGQMF